MADQILPYVPYDSAWERGPDYLAVLVGSVGGAAGITQLLRRCGVAVIEPQQRLREGITLGQWYWPVGPQDRRSIWRLWGDASAWTDWNPTQRCELPRFVPNVRAGVPSPLQLTPWKVAALRVVVQLEIAGDVSAAEIKRLGCDPSRWCRADTRWLDPAGPGRFVRSDRLPRFELQHPAEYAQLLAEARGVSA